MPNKNPEIGKSLKTEGFKTNYHDDGSGENLFLIHGSGPGVSAWANWRAVIPVLSEKFRVIAPDMVGFGHTERPVNAQYTMENWVNHAVSVMDALNIEKTHIVGNSFGGGLALALAIRYPERIKKLVLMGSVGVDFELTPGLDAVWGYQPSIENMKHLLDIFSFNQDFITDDLAEMRYRASIQPGVYEAYSNMFPAPRQRWISEMASGESDLKNIRQPTLIVHGREDAVIPVSNALTLFNTIPNAQLHLIGKCGHWTQIEHTDTFNQLLMNFLSNDRKAV